MKSKILKKLLILYFVTLVASLTIPLTKETKAATMFSWKSGTTTVTLDDVGVLTVKPTSGTGSMVDYSSVQSTSWYSYRSNIKSIVIAEGVKKLEIMHLVAMFLHHIQR